MPHKRHDPHGQDLGLGGMPRCLADTRRADRTRRVRQGLGAGGGADGVPPAAGAEAGAAGSGAGGVRSAGGDARPPPNAPPEWSVPRSPWTGAPVVRGAVGACARLVEGATGAPFAAAGRFQDRAVVMSTATAVRDSMR